MYDDRRVSAFIEATLLLLPPDVGGRSVPVSPREGSYRPFARVGGALSRVRVFEGPPRLAPGDEALVMVELEHDELPIPGMEIRLFEPDERLVGVLTVLRLCRGIVAA